MSKLLKQNVEEKVINSIVTYKKGIKRNFQITEEIFFDDDVWDFSAFNISKRATEVYKYNFNSIQECFRFGVKFVILNKLFIEKVKFSTVYKVYSDIRAISNYMKKIPGF